MEPLFLGGVHGRGWGWLTSHKECCWMFTRCCCEFVAVGCGCGLWCWAGCWFLVDAGFVLFMYQKCC